MKNIIILGVLIFVLTGILAYEQRINENKLLELEIKTDKLIEKTAEYTLHVLLTEPENIFTCLEEHPEWEAMKAVPYSSCYRHLIGSTTADYIMCMAI